MAKGKILFIAFFTVVACITGSCAQGIRAQDADSGMIHPQGEKKGPEKIQEQDGKNLERGKGEDTSPKKKPRLKYWDPFECGC